MRYLVRLTDNSECRVTADDWEWDTGENLIQFWCDGVCVLAVAVDQVTLIALVDDVVA